LPPFPLLAGKTAAKTASGPLALASDDSPEQGSHRLLFRGKLCKPPPQLLTVQLFKKSLRVHAASMAQTATLVMVKLWVNCGRLRASQSGARRIVVR